MTSLMQSLIRWLRGLSRTHLRHFPRGHLVVSLSLATLAGFTAIVPEAGSSLTNTPSGTSMELELPLPPDTMHELQREKERLPAHQWQTVKVKSGDTLSALLRNEGVSPTTIHNLVHSDDNLARLADIRPGDTLRLEVSDKGQLTALQYQPSRIETVTAERGNDGWHAQVEKRQYDHETRFAEGTIDDSLFLAGQQAGLSDNLVMQLTDIFAWDIDFVRDIRKGDHFQVLYNERYLDGQKVDDGDIVMAKFWTRGQEFTAYRYKEKDGNVDYLRPDGNSMRKQFIRTPVAFTRISSRFSMGRMHPILHRRRKHEGVDYAAPRGTPIKAAGDGVVIFAGRKGGYGNVIILKHGRKYSTLYAHMNHFARGMHYGRHVKQGQTIGYVGMTGLATGPHLHFEFRVNGVHKNPLTVPLPEAKGIASSQMPDFKAYTHRLNTQMALRAEAVKVASNQSP